MSLWGETIRKIIFALAMALAVFAVPAMAICGDEVLGQGIYETENTAFTIPAKVDVNLDELQVGNDFALAAQASLLATLDPVSAESRLRNQIALQPEAAQLHAALGDLYAAQARWASAQQAYFEAYRLADGKPQPVMVRLGASDGTATEISGGGIEAGDEMIVGERAPAAAE